MLQTVPKSPESSSYYTRLLEIPIPEKPGQPTDQERAYQRKLTINIILEGSSGNVHNQSPNQLVAESPLPSPEQTETVIVRTINLIEKELRNLDYENNNSAEITSDQIEWLKKEIESCKRELKSERNQKNRSTQEVEGQKTTNSEVTLKLKLLKLILAILEYIDETVQKDVAKNRREGRETNDRVLAEKGCEANRQFINFFCTMINSFQLEQLSHLLKAYSLILNLKVAKSTMLPLKDKLKNGGLNYFLVGLSANLIALISLKTLFPDQRFIAPTKEDDMDNGVDLIGDNESEIFLYQIKGSYTRDQSKGTGESCINVHIRSLSGSSEARREPQTKKLLEYADELEKKYNKPVKVYWVEVSIPAN